MKSVYTLLVSVTLLLSLVGCEDQNSVTQGPTSKRPAKTGGSTTTTVEEPQPVDIQTKAGSQNQNSLRHDQPDQ